MLNIDLINKFKDLTKYDLESYLLTFENFSSRGYQVIVGYYSGDIKELPSAALSVLDFLLQESKRLNNVIELNSSSFNTTDFWDLLELLEDINTNLQTVANTPKWTRTSSTNSQLSRDIETTVSLGQRETIERLLGSRLGYSDEQNEWYQVAIKNDIREEDYTPEGSVEINVPRSGLLSFNISSVVDVINKESLKGKDLNRKISWDSSSNDLSVLSGDDSFLQSVRILTELKKGDNPEFIGQGISKNLIAGTNVISLAYPVLIRQISQTFALDDTIESFEIDGISRDQDGVFVNFIVRSKSGDLFNINSTF